MLNVSLSNGFCNRTQANCINVSVMHGYLQDTFRDILQRHSVHFSKPSLNSCRRHVGMTAVFILSKDVPSGSRSIAAMKDVSKLVADVCSQARVAVFKF